MDTFTAYIAQALTRPLPVEVAEKTALHLLDTVAAVVSGSAMLPGRIAADYIREQGGRAQALVLGTGLLSTAVNAAFANGMAAHADETDDSHPRSFTHPGCAVVPAALAAAEAMDRTGLELLSAVTLGYDVATRITLAVGVQRYYAEQHRSTHSLGSLFGAAAAAGALYRLNQTQLAWVFSYVAQQASGIASWARDRDHIEKAFALGGMTARNALAAVTMVAAGFTGVDDVFTGPRAFFEAFGGDRDELVAELGTRYEVMAADIKKWAVGSPIQAPLDALQTLMREEAVKPGDIENLSVYLCDKDAHVVDNRTMPAICLQHLLSVLALDETLTHESIHDEQRMHDRDVLALRARMQLEADSAMPMRQARVVVTTDKGRTVERYVAHVRGTSQNQMTRAEVVAKAQGLMAPVLGEERAAKAIDTLLNLAAVGDAKELRALLDRRP